MNWETPTTAVIALYGAALSTVVFLSQRKDLKPRIEVHLRHGRLEGAAGTMGPLGLFLEAVNVAQTETTLWMAGASFSPTDHVQLFPAPGTPELPETVQPRRSVSFWLDRTQFAKELRERELHREFRVQFFLEDELHRVYRTPWITLDASHPELAP